MRSIVLVIALLIPAQAKAIFGMELGPLLKLVAGQVVELERLAEIAGASKDQANALRALNNGIDKTVEQIETVQIIIERADGLDPSSIRSVRELNDQLERVKDLKEKTDQIMMIRLKAAEIGISQSSLQADTSYRMGQEMIGTGSMLAQESKQASPGRAAQISASSNSAQMMAKGVELQTMSQLVQLQALSLDLQRSQIEKEISQRQSSRDIFISTLESPKVTKKGAK